MAAAVSGFGGQCNFEVESATTWADWDWELDFDEFQEAIVRLSLTAAKQDSAKVDVANVRCMNPIRHRERNIVVTQVPALLEKFLAHLLPNTRKAVVPPQRATAGTQRPSLMAAARQSASRRTSDSPATVKSLTARKPT